MPDKIKLEGKEMSFDDQQECHLRSDLIELFCLFSLSIVHCWDLSSFGLDSVIVNHVNVVRNRAILSVPRLNQNQNVTLLEAPWPEKNMKLYKVSVYPKNTIQTVGDCSTVQSAVSSDDDSRGKLYVLDAGFNICEPKVIVYDLRTNKKITDTALSGVSPSRLHSIVVDTASPQGIRAYIGDPGDGFMIVYNANNRHWWRANLAIPSGPRINYIPTYDMIMSMSRTEPKLYITSEETDKLFSLTLSEIRSFENPAAVFCDSTEYNATTLSTHLEGSKLGKSVGLTVDLRNGVYYYLQHDYACMRWDSRQPMRAESHDVILQSADRLPSVKQLFTDYQNQIWALLGTQSQNGEHCLQLRKPNYLPVLYP